MRAQPQVMECVELYGETAFSNAVKSAAVCVPTWAVLGHAKNLKPLHYMAYFGCSVQ